MIIHRPSPRPVLGFRRRAALLFLIGLLASCLPLAGCGPYDAPGRPGAERPTGQYTPPPPPAPPTFQDFEGAAKLYMDGSFERALELLEAIAKSGLTGDQARQVRFLTAAAAYRAGRFEDAAGLLSAREAIDPALDGWAAYLRGLSLDGAGRHEEAIAALEASAKADSGAVWAGQARLTAAWARYHQGRYKEAVEAAKKLLKNEKAGEVRLALARMYEGMGEDGRALDYYAEAMGNSNMRDVRAEASIKYEQLLTPLARAEGNDKAKLDLVRFLRRGWRLEEALSRIAEFQKTGGQGIRDSLAGEKSLITYFLGRNEEALPAYSNSGSATGRRMKARILDRMGRWQEAAEAYTAAGKSFGASKSADEALYDAGLMYLRAGQEKNAEEAFGRIREASRKGRYRDDILWAWGFHYYRNKKYDLAAERLKTIVEDIPKSRLRRQAMYWLARALEKDGRKPAAHEYLVDLADDPKEPYYKMLAEKRLGIAPQVDHWPDLPVFRKLLDCRQPSFEYSFEPLLINETTAQGTDFWALSDPGLSFGDLWTERRRLMAASTAENIPADVKTDFTRVRALAAAGALDMAGREAEPLWYRIRSDGRCGTIELPLYRFVCAHQAYVGDYAAWVRLQYKNFSRLLKGRTENQKILAQRRFFPLAFPGPVMKAANEFHLHPALLLSVIRTESYYQPGILSAANARGLMQILPSTGQKIAAHLDTGVPHPSVLFSPEVNIRFGAWYLSALTKEFDGQLPLAIASYNAGPFNVKRWAENAKGATLEEFIELIPFDQTNLYVKKILGTMYYHRLLYSGTPHCPNLSAPLRTVFRNEINF